MKKIFFFTIVILLIMPFISFAQVSFDSLKIRNDEKLMSLSPKYIGHDIVTIYDVLSKRTSIKKDPFETTEQYELRKKNELSKPIVGNLTVNDELAFMVENFKKEYNADSAKWTFSIGLEQYDENIKGLGVGIKSLRMGDNQAMQELLQRNTRDEKRKKMIMGKSTINDDIAEGLLSSAIKAGGTWNLWIVAFTSIPAAFLESVNTSKKITSQFTMSPATAKQVNEHIRALVICSLDGSVRSGYFSKDFIMGETKTVFAGLNRIIIYNYLTGEIYTSEGGPSTKNRGKVGIIIKNKVVTKLMDNGPAEKAGIMKGDIILKVDGEALTGDHGTDLLRITGPPGSTAILLINRNGQELTIPVVRGNP